MIKLANLRKINLINLFVTFLFCFYIFSIFFAPRWYFGKLPNGKTLDLRLDDIVVGASFLAWASFVVLGGKIQKLTAIACAILVYLSIVSASTFLSIFTHDTGLAGFLYFGKQIEGLTFCFIFISLGRYLSFKTIRISILIGIFCNLAFSFWQILTSDYYGKANGYYGVGSIGEPSTLSSGLVFTFSGIYLLVMKRGKIFSGISSFIAIVTTFSRASLFGFLAVLFFNDTKRKTKIWMLLSTLCLVFGGLSIFYTFPNIPIVTRFVSPVSQLRAVSLRMDLYVKALSGGINVFDFLIGKGAGFVTLAGIPREVHNNILRFYMEVGLIGTLILFQFFRIVKSMFYRSRDQFLKIFLQFSLVIAVASLFQDALMNQKAMSFLSIMIVLGTESYRRSLITKNPG